MVCTVFSISASADGFSVNRHNFTLFALCRQPVVQAARKLRRVQLFKNAAECITVRYTVRKFEKISQKILSFLTKLFYISEVLPSAYYGTHSNDDNLKLMANVSVSRSPRLSDIFHLFFQCFYVQIVESVSGFNGFTVNFLLPRLASQVSFSSLLLEQSF